MKHQKQIIISLSVLASPFIVLAIGYYGLGIHDHDFIMNISRFMGLTIMGVLAITLVSSRFKRKEPQNKQTAV